MAGMDIFDTPCQPMRFSIRLFQNLDSGFIAMNDAAIQQAVAHQIQQGLEVLAALDDPACQGLT
ncbi:hypothetical protein HMPREF1487_09019 [Pseudomonas sp. HPB0071]|nr:hypothetical protein HMPREF1487_09019 [Pseudomonas sp. HPB0071]